MPITGTVPVTAPVAPTSEQDVYPSHDERWGKGGYRTVADLNALAAITADRRTVGMLVRVASTNQTFRMESDLTTWTEVVILAKTEADLSLSGRISKPEALKQYTLSLQCTSAGKVTAFTRKTGSNSLTFEVQINGVPIAGLSSLTANTNKTTSQATSGNTFQVGDTITLVVTAVSNLPEDFDFTLHRSL